MFVNPLPPIDRQTVADRLRNFFYPVSIFVAIALVWAIGWASSVEARANVGYWSAMSPGVVYSPIPATKGQTWQDAEHTSEISSVEELGD